MLWTGNAGGATTVNLGWRYGIKVHDIEETEAEKWSLERSVPVAVAYVEGSGRLRAIFVVNRERVKLRQVFSLTTMRGGLSEDFTP